jgi:hypothetical protein
VEMVVLSHTNVYNIIQQKYTCRTSYQLHRGGSAIASTQSWRAVVVDLLCALETALLFHFRDLASCCFGNSEYSRASSTSTYICVHLSALLSGRNY